MELFVNSLQLARLDMGVDLGGLDAGMTEHFLNEPQVGATRQEMSCKAVSQSMRRCFLGDSNPLRIPFD